MLDTVWGRDRDVQKMTHTSYTALKKMLNLVQGTRSTCLKMVVKVTFLKKFHMNSNRQMLKHLLDEIENSEETELIGRSE